MPNPDTTPLDLALDRLASAGCNPKQSRPGQWNARCPVNDNHRNGDKNPSLSLGEGAGGTALLTCHSGCTLPDVARALDLKVGDLFPAKPPSVAHITGGKRVKATYAYYDVNGVLVFEVVRYQPKGFRQRRPAGDGWIWNLNGIDRYPLYHAPQVARAIADRKPIWITEGEKDAEALQWVVEGATACNSGGAGSWRPEHTEALIGAVDVTIVADDDDKGWEHARQVAGRLYTVGLPVAVWAPPEGFKDAAEALGAGKSLGEFRRVWDSTSGADWITGGEATEQEDAAATDERNDLLAQLIDWGEFWAADHGAEEWIAWPLIPAGRQVALFAVAKTGKSIITLAACAAVATGTPILGGKAQPRRSVLYLDYEMTADDLQARLESLGYSAADDLSLLHYALLPSLPPLNTPAGCKALCELAEAVDAEVVVIDTMGRAVQGEENSADSYREFARTTGLTLKAAGRAVLRTDHAGKEKDRGQRGSSAKNDDVDVVVRVDATEGGWTLTRTHSRIAWVPDKVTIVKDEAADGVVRFVVDRRARTYLPGTKELADTLRDLGVTASMGRRPALDALAAAGMKVRTRRVGDALAWLREEEPKFTEPVDNGREPPREPPSERFREPEPGTTGTTTENPRSEHGNHYGNQWEPASAPDGNQGSPRSGNHGPMAVPEIEDDGSPETAF